MRDPLLDQNNAYLTLRTAENAMPPAKRPKALQTPKQ